MPEELSVVASAVADYKEANGIEAGEDATGDTSTYSEDSGSESTRESVPEDAADSISESSDTPAPETPAVAPIVPAVEEDYSLPPKLDKDGRVNRIPQPRVAKMIEKATTELETKFTTEREAHAAKIAEHDKRFQEIANVENLMFDQQEKFLGILENIPGYKEKLAARYGGGAPAAAAVDADPMPEPDTENGYSKEGLAKLFDWNGRQVEKRIAERYKPIEDERESVKRQTAQDARLQAIKADFYTWEGAKENEDAVAAAMAADGRLSLHGAYQKVVVPLLKSAGATDKAKMRAEIIAELKKAPASTGTTSTPAKRSAPVDDGPRDPASIVRAAVRAASR